MLPIYPILGTDAFDVVSVSLHAAQPGSRLKLRTQVVAHGRDTQDVDYAAPLGCHHQSFGPQLEYGELAWERKHSEPVDREWFTREVVPALSGVSAGALARATGLSVSQCAKVKKGERVPHPMRWEAIRTLSSGAPHLAVPAFSGSVTVIRTRREE
jgi:hypothetical protein